ncbi:MAG: LPS-assembly protein LptD [Chitinophagaceae bacterium]|nr:LPS-assembly protein LptD [Chitinophagaceae bacterium]
MNIAYKVNYKYVLLTVSAVLVLYGLTVEGSTAFRSRQFFGFTLTSSDTVPAAKSPVPRNRPVLIPTPVKADSIPPKRDSLRLNDSLLVNDSLVQKVDTFGLKISKDSLDSPVEYEAEDSMVIDIPGEKMYIYNKAQVKFKDISLDAAIIKLDQPTQLLTAYYTMDSTGKRMGVPAFKQGEEAFTADSILYNFKTQKGLTVGTYTQQQEMFVYVEKSKRIAPDAFYGKGARFTSCNFDTPHFAFRAKKTKFMSNKLAVTGPVRPEFEGVPIPVGLPFGLFPLKQGRRTGLLPPQPTVNSQLGFGLEGLGYYKTFGEYWDATIRTNIYSYGSWNLFLSPSYRKRYRYNGNFNLSFMNNKVNFKDDPDFSTSKNFALQWSHSVDGKARPGQNFSASVNIATSLFNRFFPNSPVTNFNNQLNSSIAYQRSWAGKPYNLTVTANHNQNTQQRLYNITLPALGFTVNTIYPFQKKEFAGTPKWYEKLGIAYNGTFNNQISFIDSTVTLKHLVDTLDWTANHSIPIQLSLPPLGPLQVGPAISYSETWNSRAYARTWNPVTKQVETSSTRGFYRSRQMSVGLNLSTALFGTMNFKRKTGVQALRHVVRPTVGFGYTPNLNRNNWSQVQVDSLGNKLWFDRFNGITANEFFAASGANISFSIDNNLELKTRSKTDTTEQGIKKVRLIDGFGVSSAYNLLLDSFALSDFNFYFRSNLFDKVSITASANVSPYQFTSTGRKLPTYAWQGNDFSLGKFTSGFISLNTQFRSKPKNENLDKEKKELERNQSYEMDERSRELAMVQNNPGEFADFNIPWSLNLSYSLNLSRIPKGDLTGFTTQLTQSVNFNGDFNLTEKWKIQGQGTFDIQTRELQYATFSVARDLHCWQLAINVTPIGPIRTFSITINPKSSLLRDLRINRSRFFYNNIPR